MCVHWVRVLFPLVIMIPFGIPSAIIPLSIGSLLYSVIRIIPMILCIIPECHTLPTFPTFPRHPTNPNQHNYCDSIPPTVIPFLPREC